MILLTLTDEAALTGPHNLGIMFSIGPRRQDAERPWLRIKLYCNVSYSKHWKARHMPSRDPSTICAMMPSQILNTHFMLHVKWPRYWVNIKMTLCVAYIKANVLLVQFYGQLLCTVKSVLFRSNEMHYGLKTSMLEWKMLPINDFVSLWASFVSHVVTTDRQTMHFSLHLVTV